MSPTVIIRLFDSNVLFNYYLFVIFRFLPPVILPSVMLVFPSGFFSGSSNPSGKRTETDCSIAFEIVFAVRILGLFWPSSRFRNVVRLIDLYLKGSFWPRLSHRPFKPSRVSPAVSRNSLSLFGNGASNRSNSVATPCYISVAC
jgi:hypothetical protein